MSTLELNQYVADFFARFGRLIANGVPLLSALEVSAAEKAQYPAFQLMLKRMIRSIEIGHTLSSSMSAYNFFPQPLISAIMNAEQKGILDVVLQGLPGSILQGDFPLGELPSLDVLEAETTTDEHETIPVLVETLLRNAVLARASDMHIEPTRTGSIIRFRIDGTLHRQEQQLTPMQHQAVVSRLKIMAGLDVAERKLPQDGRHVSTLEMLDDHKEQKKVKIDLRVSICNFFHGEKVVIRFLDQGNFPETFERIMIGERLAFVRTWLKKPHGLILVTGPSGCGKTTTLYMMIQELAAREAINVLTVEDPVEFLLPNTNQMQIQPSLGLTFETALRALLRQDPDVIAVGEVRDPETALLMSKVAMTGHLVLSQLHTHDSIAALTLLREAGVPFYSLRQSLVGIVAQRLVRRLCPECKRLASPDEMKNIPESFRQCNNHHVAVGCRQCSGIGYKGRLALYEIFEPSPAFWNMVAEGASEQTLRAMIREKHLTLFDHGCELIEQGLTTWSEVERTTS